MNLILHKSSIEKQASVTISGSKSESNRLLLLQALYPEIAIENLSNSDDSQVMQLALSTTENTIDIHHAGTAMRFLTAYFATRQNREVVLTGSQRMKERPIQILVEALMQLGAQIDYLETFGCPPLRIVGKELVKDRVSLKANVSSQYISALLLIAPRLKNGLELILEGKITSVPYIEMTLDLLHQIGVETSFKEQTIKVNPLGQIQRPLALIVESDWSSASYFYGTVALSKVGTMVTLTSYKQSSLQGDAVLAKIYTQFGVETNFNDNRISIQKTAIVNPKSKIELDLSNAPDIAQTIAVTCLGLGLECVLTGLHTLKIKETDRLEALKNEIKKFGAEIEVTDKSLHLKSNAIFSTSMGASASDGSATMVSISTYNDHRMAMAFAPLALKTQLQIEDAGVVSKSYPNFWNDLKSIGFQLRE